ncbi:hypothetical protein LNV09_10190 [Paucibacter sp. B2R-40]|nr:hypothetical protein [Paucibacter sp. B2R-40]
MDAILVGKECRFNRRFMALANHYFFQPVACIPESGWKKGQVENQVGNVREWLFTPMAHFKRFELLNEWLSKRCQELGARSHPAEADRTIAHCFEQDRARLRPVASDCAGYVEQMMRVSSTCLVRVDRNRYSVPADFARKEVSVRVFADQIRLVVDGQVIAQHGRRFGRDQLIFDPWHYLPVLEKKLGALRNGAPFV